MIDLDHLDIERTGDHYRVTWPGGFAIVLVDVLPAGNGWKAEPRVELQSGEWPDDGIEAEATRRVIAAWESEPRADEE